jgi:hypothetical protein
MRSRSDAGRSAKMFSFAVPVDARAAIFASTLASSRVLMILSFNGFRSFLLHIAQADYDARDDCDEKYV